jgi:NADPH:quinone reductase-like Zn-dependent oxidoreductase
MKAIVQDRYGPADVLDLRDVDPPAIGAGEVLVRVRAAGVDRGAWHVMTGRPYAIRLTGVGIRRPKNPVIGMDVAGVVEAVGEGVTTFRPGDEVMGVGKGTFAELTRARADRLVRKPAGLTFEQAAVIPLSGITALQALRDKGHVEAGQRVLVIGASGGVGTFAVQIAKAFGATVTGVCGPTKVDLVRSLGADRVLDYTRDDFATDRYDLILDIGGRPAVSRLRSALTAKGTLVIVGGEASGRWLGGAGRQVRALLLSPFVGQRLTAFVSTQSVEDLLVLTALVEAGKVTPVVDRSFPLAEVPKAIRYLDEGHARGKVVVVV